MAGYYPNFATFVMDVAMLNAKPNTLYNESCSPIVNTVKPVLRGHLWDREKVAL
jgi:hypothetical protein